jgi:FixJ family two-component response regulator
MTNTGPIVYVVDDDLSVRKSLARLLRSVGLEAEIFCCAQDFISCDLPDRPSCLVLDIRMPGVTGLELQEKMVAADRSIPIIFITGFGNVPASVQAMKAGAFDFLEKPVQAITLLDAIDRAVDYDRKQRKKNREYARIKQRSESLTAREKTVFELVVAGMLNKQIAFQLGVAEKTVKVHRGRIMQKMGAQSLADLVRMAERLK